MSCVMIDGKPHLALISCHHNDTFSFLINGRWVTDRTVPRVVLDAPSIPAEERRRVLSRMAEAGVSPS